MGQQGRDTFTQWSPRFLEVLQKTPNVTAAAKAVGINKRTVNRHREKNAKFDEKCREALDESVDLLEAVVYNRAIGGSDLLAMFLLKAYKPEKFRERQEISGALQHEIKFPSIEDVDAELDRIEPGLERRRQKAALTSGDDLPPGFEGPV